MEYTLQSHVWRDLGALEGADGSGYANVRLVESPDGAVAVAKLFPRSTRAYREILINEQAQLVNVKNVVPILDSGEHEDEESGVASYVLVMPRAEKSLAKHIADKGGKMGIEASIRILRSIAVTLEDIYEKVIHRDIKPANILKYGEEWRLADFGLARAAHEQTATETWKGHGTRQYVAPETIKGNTPTSAADVYSFGVMAYELLEGRLPYAGDNPLQAHLTDPPIEMTVDSPHLRAMVLSCLNKTPEARPTPIQISRRLLNAQDVAGGPGVLALANANADITYSQAVEQARVAEAEAREALAQVMFDKASAELALVADQLEVLITESATLAETARDEGNGKMLLVARLGSGYFGISSAEKGEAWEGAFHCVRGSYCNNIVGTNIICRD